jgi:hypothetical protein
MVTVHDLPMDLEVKPRVEELGTSRQPTLSNDLQKVPPAPFKNKTKTKTNQQAVQA